MRTGSSASERVAVQVRPEHLRRKAIVYVRQSTLRQVENNRESTALQYGLRDRAVQLGWPEDRITVIDHDLGVSGGGVERAGFRELVAATGLGEGGSGFEFGSFTLSRNLADWGQLLALCALSDTLIADADKVYDISDSHDRFFLGIMGTVSEAELHMIKRRMHAGREAKASRGALGMALPRAMCAICRDGRFSTRTPRFRPASGTCSTRLPPAVPFPEFFRCLCKKAASFLDGFVPDRCGTR